MSPKHTSETPGQKKYNTITVKLQTCGADLAAGRGTTVTSEKAVDGVIFVVEQARTKEKTLAFFTMWVEKR